MNRFSLSVRVWCGISALILGSSLFGCSAAKNAINNSLPPVNDALRLDGKTFTGEVGVSPDTSKSRAAIVGSGTQSFTFDNYNISQASSITSINHVQSLDKSVTVVVPSGKKLPATFTLSSIKVTATISETQVNTDGSSVTRTFTAPLNIQGTVVYTRTGTTSAYQTTSNPTFDPLQISGTQLDQFRNVITSGPTPNKLTVVLSFTTDDKDLPNGTRITFTATGGTAKVKI